MLQSFTVSFLFSIAPALLLYWKECNLKVSLFLAVVLLMRQALLQIEIKPDNGFPHDILSMVLSDLSSGMKDTIVAVCSIASNNTATIMSKDTCLPANHSLYGTIWCKDWNRSIIKLHKYFHRNTFWISHCSWSFFLTEWCLSWDYNMH